MKKKISGPVSGPIGTWNFNGPDGPNAVMAPVTESQARNSHRNRNTAESKYQNIKLTLLMK